MQKNKLSSLKGKVIRDSVHGDIFVEKEFLDLVDTPEFQRLRRIKQLATANLVFPSAEHTRFSHSIGTFFIMKKLITHFEAEFKRLDLKNISSRDKNVALAAAILHDIGHGPFSHAFEGAFPFSKEHSNHEQWTTKIISSEDSNIYKILVKNFDENFPYDVAALIQKKYEYKKKGFSSKETEDIDLFFVLSSLVSGQLDADRMDYLLRDSQNTGVPYGKVDISRLISSMRLTVNNEYYYVCILEKYLSDVEGYLISRYQMHKGVYYHKFKCEMEIIMKKIMMRAYELYKEKRIYDNEIPNYLRSVFNNRLILTEEYTYLDDSVLLALFSKWKTSEDYILSSLCKCILDRSKFTELILLDNSCESIENFQDGLKIILKKYNYIIKDFDKEYFWIQNSEETKTYKNQKDNIWILRIDGTLNDLSKVSKVITEDMDSKINMVFINHEILTNSVGFDKSEELINDLEKLLSIFDSRNHIEIEKKYYLNDKHIFNDVITLLESYNRYEIINIEEKEQVDYYYDTDDNYLYHNDRTIRIRKKSGINFITVKIPTITDTEKNLEELIKNQSERFEYEKEITSEDVNKNKQFITKYIPEISEKQLIKSLIIKNKRRKIMLYNKNNKDIAFEMVFDNVKYENMEGKIQQDYQIEIEMKSDYSHKVNLKVLTDYIEKNISGINSTLKSKYQRGLELIVDSNI